MRDPRRRANLVRPIAVALLAVFLSGCMHWSRTDLEPQHLPHRVRVTLQTGAQMQLGDPTIEGDSLVGFDPARRSIPLTQVKLAQVRKIDGGATARLIAGAFVAARLIGALAMDTGAWTMGLGR